MELRNGILRKRARETYIWQLTNECERWNEKMRERRERMGEKGGTNERTRDRKNENT